MSSMLKVTVIGESFGVEGKDINIVLTEIGFQKKGEKGGYILLQRGTSFGEQKLSKENKPYVLWRESLLDEDVFLEALDSYRNPTKDVVMVPVDATEHKNESSVKSIENENEKKPFKFDRMKFKPEFRTADGHFVRSKSEVIISNWLYMNNIVQAYEKRVPITEELYSDFFLKLQGIQVYIEYWGLENDPKYVHHKGEKIALYKKYGFNLIELDENDIKDIDDILPIKLLAFGIQVR